MNNITRNSGNETNHLAKGIELLWAGLPKIACSMKFSVLFLLVLFAVVGEGDVLRSGEFFFQLV